MKKYKILKWVITIVLPTTMLILLGVIFQKDNVIPGWVAFVTIALYILTPIVYDAIVGNSIPEYGDYVANKKATKKNEKAIKKANKAVKDVIVKIEVLGTNQAFNTGIITGITWNDTEYTCKITYGDGHSEVKKLDGKFLNKHADLIVAGNN